MDSRGGRPEETGRALLTGGYHLPAAHVIHTVGPVVEGEVGEEHRRLLASSYRSVLDAAEAAGLDSVGLCSVSTGVFGYPKEEAAPLVLDTTLGGGGRELVQRAAPLVLDTTGAWLAAHPAGRMRIVVCAFAEADVIAYEKALAARLRPGR